MRNTTHPPELERMALSAAELAQRLGISERHLWGCLANGRLGPQPIALGRSKKWNAAEVQAWLDAGGPSRDEWQAAKRGA